MQKAFIPILVAGGASVLGLAIALGNWLYLVPFVAVAAIPVVVRWPVQISLGVYAFLIPFDPILVLGGGTTGPTLTKLAGVAAAAILLGTGLIGRRLVRPPQAALWWFLFILWGALSALWAVDTEEVLLRLPTAVSLLFLYLVVVSVNVSEKELSSVYLFIVLGGIVASGCTIYLYQEGIFSGEGGRTSLVFGEQEANPNALSFSLVLPIALAIYSYAMSLRLWNKVLYLATIAVMMAGFFLTMSRGPLAGLLVFFLAYSVLSSNKRRLIYPLGLLVLVALMMPETFYGRLNLFRDPSGAGRLVIWQVGWLAVKEYWVLGAGLSNFPLAYNQFAQAASGFLGYGKGGHNIYLTAIVELGVVGLAILVYAMWSHLRRLKEAVVSFPGNQGQARNVIEAACLGIMVSAFFRDVIWSKAFWLPWMLMILARHSGRWGDKKVEMS